MFERQAEFCLIRVDIVYILCIKIGTGTLTIQPDRLIHDDLKSMQLKPKSAELCVRETRWTEENLKKLHADLRAIRLKSNETEKTSNLVKCKLIVRTPSLPSTPISSNMRNNEEKLIDQYATLIQAIIKGRAIQTMVIMLFTMSFFIGNMIMFASQYLKRCSRKEMNAEN